MPRLVASDLPCPQSQLQGEGEKGPSAGGGPRQGPKLRPEHLLLEGIISRPDRRGGSGVQRPGLTGHTPPGSVFQASSPGPTHPIPHPTLSSSRTGSCGQEEGFTLREPPPTLAGPPGPRFQQGGALAIRVLRAHAREVAAGARPAHREPGPWAPAEQEGCPPQARPHQLCPSSPSARRSTPCCAPTSPAGAPAPGAPSASCSTATRSAPAAGQLRPQPRSPAARLPGAGPPLAMGPGEVEGVLCGSSGDIRDPWGAPTSRPALWLQILKETSVLSGL